MHAARRCFQFDFGLFRGRILVQEEKYIRGRFLLDASIIVASVPGVHLRYYPQCGC